MASQHIEKVIVTVGIDELLNGVSTKREIQSRTRN